MEGTDFIDPSRVTNEPGELRVADDRVGVGRPVRHDELVNDVTRREDRAITLRPSCGVQEILDNRRDLHIEEHAVRLGPDCARLASALRTYGREGLVDEERHPVTKRDDRSKDVTTVTDLVHEPGEGADRVGLSAVPLVDTDATVRCDLPVRTPPEREVLIGELEFALVRRHPKALVDADPLHVGDQDLGLRRSLADITRDKVGGHSCPPTEVVWTLG